MNNFQEKRQSKIERFKELAKKFEAQSTQAYEQSSKIGQHIPFGQPILVGHHSEGRHRRDLAKIGRYMDQSVELSNKAEYYERRAGNMEKSKVISQDDPEAVDKIETKLEKLEKLQKLMKDANKIIKSKKTSKEGKTLLLMELGLKAEQAEKLMEPDFCGRIGFPSYALTNNNANIRRLKERSKEIESKRADETTETIINGVTIKDSVEDNRVQIFFNGKPAEEVRTELKKNGFKWSPLNSCWQNYRNRWNIERAKEIVNKFFTA